MSRYAEICPENEFCLKNNYDSLRNSVTLTIFFASTVSIKEKSQESFEALQMGSFFQSFMIGIGCNFWSFIVFFQPQNSIVLNLKLHISVYSIELYTYRVKQECFLFFITFFHASLQSPLKGYKKLVSFNNFSSAVLQKGTSNISSHFCLPSFHFFLYFMRFL